MTPPHLTSHQTHSGAPASRGIWKCLKLPRRWPGAPTAPILSGNRQFPYGCGRPIGSLAGQLFKPPGCQMPRGSARHPPSPPNQPSVKARHSGVSSAGGMVPKQSLPWPAHCPSQTEVGDCPRPGFPTHSCQASECSQCSSTAALRAFD